MDRKQNKSGGARRGRKALTIIGIVLLVLVAAVIGYAIWERPPEIVIPAVTEKPAATPAVTVRPDDPAQPSAPPAEDDPTDFIDPDALVTDREPGTYTILLVGRDYASNSTDTIIVARLDTKAHRIDCVSIPRDTLINISWGSTPKRINTVYPGYTNSGKDPIEGIKTHIRNLIGFDVDCYSVVNIKAMEDAVDTIGGVWFDVPQDMVYEDYVQNLDINIKKGYQKLSGSDALKLCRFRATYSGGDIQRIGVQQDFLKAMAGQLLSLGSIPHLGELIDIILEDVDTDLTAANLAWFARQFLSCRSEDITFQTVPISGAGNSINGVSLVGVNVSAWLEMVNANINPYVDDVTEGNVNILTYGYGGASIGSTTGSIAGGWDSFYCQSCTAATGHATHHAPGKHLALETQKPSESGGGEEAPPEDNGGTPELTAPTETEESPEPGPKIVVAEPGAEPKITE